MARNGNALLSLAAGFGSGYLGAQRQTKLDDERAEDRSMRKQEFDAKMSEVNDAKNTRIGLADAARPVAVEQGAGGAIKPETMDNRDVGLPENASQPNNGLALADYRVKGKTFTDKPTAEAAAAAENAPTAIAKRQADVLRQAGRPGDAMAVEQTQMKFQREQQDYARKLEDEGAFAAVRALRSGDPAGIAAAFNKGGKYKIDGVPEVVREDRDVPGVGKIPTYTAKMRMVGPDGQPIEKVYNSHDLSMQLLPYEKQMDILRKGTESDSKNANREGLLTLKEATLEAKTATAAAKAASGGGAPSREERLRYTSLFSDAGRRAGEAQKALTALQKDPMYSRAQPGTPRAQELQDLRDTIKAHNEERSTYQSMLAGSQGKDKTPSLADAKKPAAPAAAPKAAGGKQDFSKLWN